MPNEQNLIPLNKRTKREQREIQADGGRASGVSRRRRKSLKEAADLYLSLPPSNRKRWNSISKTGVDPEDIDNQMAMIIGLTERAIQGDAKAAKVLVGLLGEKPEEEKNRDGMLSDLIDGLLEDDLYTETERLDEDMAERKPETD